jgi:hypothetical protein
MWRLRHNFKYFCLLTWLFMDLWSFKFINGRILWIIVFCRDVFGTRLFRSALLRSYYVVYALFFLSGIAGGCCPHIYHLHLQWQARATALSCDIVTTIYFPTIYLHTMARKLRIFLLHFHNNTIKGFDQSIQFCFLPPQSARSWTAH